MKGSYICTKCGKSLASLQSLWNHKQRCKDTGERKRSRNTDGLSEKHDDPAFINSTYSRTYNVPPTQPSLTFVAAADAVKESSVKHRPKNPKIQALLNEIFNDDDPDRNVTPQVIHKGFSIAPPPSTTTSLSLKPSRLLLSSAAKSHQQQQQHSTLTMREEPVMKKIKLSSSAARSKADIRNLPQSNTLNIEILTMMLNHLFMIVMMMMMMMMMMMIRN